MDFRYGRNTAAHTAPLFAGPSLPDLSRRRLHRSHGHENASNRHPFSGLSGCKLSPMTCEELKALCAERRESYGKVFQSVLTEMMDRYGCTGINKTDMYTFPVFSQRSEEHTSELQSLRHL